MDSFEENVDSVPQLAVQVGDGWPLVKWVVGLDLSGGQSIEKMSRNLKPRWIRNRRNRWQIGDDDTRKRRLGFSDRRPVKPAWGDNDGEDGCGRCCLCPQDDTSVHVVVIVVVSV